MTKLEDDLRSLDAMNALQHKLERLLEVLGRERMPSMLQVRSWCRA